MTEIIEQHLLLLMNSTGFIPYIESLYYFIFNALAEWTDIEQYAVSNLSVAITSLVYVSTLIFIFIIAYNIVKFAFKGVLKICGLV